MNSRSFPFGFAIIIVVIAPTLIQRGGRCPCQVAGSCGQHSVTHLMRGTSMKLRAALVTTVLFLAMVFPFSSASAESITVLSGSMIVDGLVFQGGDRPTLELRGTHGFRLIAIPEIFSSSGPWQCRPCDATGARLQVSTFQGGSDLPGTVDFEGTQFTLLGFEGTTIGLDFQADDAFLPPARLGTQVAVISEPFELSSISALRLPDVGGEPVPEIPLFGQGRATIELRANQSGSPEWQFTRASYVFGSTAPVPEPATILLVGGGMIAAVRRTRRRCHARCQRAAKADRSA
jgi:PEP-CTERM motif